MHTRNRNHRVAHQLQLRLRKPASLYVPEIDGLRFIAIISVVLYHISVQTRIGAYAGAQHNLYWLAVSNGARGVPLFFAISGFILGQPFANHFLQWKAPVRLKSYFLRRVTRLEPPYILTTIVRSVISVLMIHKPLRTLLPSMMASLFYVHNLVFAHSS